MLNIRSLIYKQLSKYQITGGCSKSLY